MPTESIKVTPVRLILTGLYLLAYPLVLLALAGDWRWVQGWIFSLWFVALCAATIVFLYLKDPELLAERYRRPSKEAGEASWDIYVVYSLSVLFTAWFTLMPLDARRFHWSPEVPLWVTIAGAALLGVASFFLFRAFSDNTYLSPLVRLQSERRQQVVSTGVYALVRHPMYLGAACLMIGGPLFLGSLYGLIPGLLMILMLVVRIIGEEKLLVTKLEGYQDYRKRVRYRLLPFVW